MVYVQGFSLFKIAVALFLVAKTIIAEGHHVFAVNLVAHLKVVFPYQEVGQGDGEIVHPYLVEEMLLAIVDQLVETAVRPSLSSAIP